MAIIGAIVGAIAVAAVAVGGLFFLYKRRTWNRVHRDVEERLVVSWYPPPPYEMNEQSQNTTTRRPLDGLIRNVATKITRSRTSHRSGSSDTPSRSASEDDSIYQPLPPYCEAILPTSEPARQVQRPVHLIPPSLSQSSIPVSAVLRPPSPSPSHFAPNNGPRQEPVDPSSAPPGVGHQPLTRLKPVLPRLNTNV